MIRLLVALAMVFAVTSCYRKGTNCGDFGDDTHTSENNSITKTTEGYSQQSLRRIQVLPPLTAE